MNSRLRSLLKLAGVIVIATTGALVPLYVARPGVTPAELLDAGLLSDSVKREARCLMVCEGNRLETRRIRGRYFGTGASGGFMPIKPHLNGCRPFDVGTHAGTGEPLYLCRPVAPADEILGANEDERTEEHQCACAPATDAGAPIASTCRLTDGGVPDVRVHLPEGSWTGNCQRKACGEIAGSSTWPEACGPESVR